MAVPRRGGAFFPWFFAISFASFSTSLVRLARPFLNAASCALGLAAFGPGFELAHAGDEANRFFDNAFVCH